MAKSESFGISGKEKIHVFCQNSSLRGVNKIIKSPTPLLRILWCGYVLLMIFLLTFSVGKILIEYLAYDTTVQTSVKLDHPSSFPSLTICNHYPFSERAFTLWNEKKVQSPSEYNHNLRKIMRQLIRNKEYNLSATIYSQDKLSSYYQNLSADESRKISHPIGKFFKYCLSRTQGKFLMIRGYFFWTKFQVD